MGALVSRYQQTDFDESRIYTWNEDSSVEMNEFQTGDLIFFTNDFPDSSIIRGFRRMKNTLWSSGGIVLYAPTIWRNEVLLLEFGKFSDDFLTDKLTLKNVGAGFRLVSLADRLRRVDFEAIGICKIQPRDRLQPSVETQFKFINTLKDIVKDKTINSNNFMINALKKMDIVKVGYANLSLNALAGSALRRYAEYRKLEIIAFKSLEHEQPKHKTFKINT
jgi:hypothetical protein